MHLTNDAVQKDMPHYGTFEVNNKMSMSELQDALGSQVRTAAMPMQRDNALITWKRLLFSKFLCLNVNVITGRTCMNVVGKPRSLDGALMHFHRVQQKHRCEELRVCDT